MFVPSGEGIHVTIVDQGVVAIAPGESLGPDTKMIIGTNGGGSCSDPSLIPKALTCPRTMTGMAANMKAFFQSFQPSGSCPADMLRTWPRLEDLACWRNLT